MAGKAGLSIAYSNQKFTPCEMPTVKNPIFFKGRYFA
jgi:hypothetical protein